MCRLAAVVPLGLCWLVASVLPAEEPLRTVVRVDVANVHSGPSEKYYVTAELPQGAAVEIYRMTADGWCGIRPPRDSFSYVRAEHVRVDESNPDQLIAIVDKTKTRVGSLLSAAHNVEYIALDEGERLVRVGEPVRLGSPPVKWQRVSPPAGEFRWIRRDDLEINDTVETPATPLAKIDSTPPSDEPTASTSVDETKPSAEEAVAKAAPDTLAAQIQTTPETKSPQPAPPARPRGSMATIPIPVKEPPTDQVTTVEPKPAAPVAKPSSAWKAVGTSTMDARPVQVAATPTVTRPTAPEAAAPTLITAIAELDIELAQQVKKNVERWQLDRLLVQANNLHVRAMDASTREKVAALRNRIVQFQDIQRRHVDLAPLNDDLADGQVALASAVVPAPRPPVEGTRRALVTHSLQPDVVRVEGWLVPVAGSGQNLPRFALTDQNGEILCFVAPSRGMNLARLQTSPVQVVGRRSASSGDQILADRVTPIRSLRR